MASPQKENGYTVIAHELLEAVIAHKFTQNELKVILYLVRKTYGYHKKEDWVSLSQFVEATGMEKANVSRIISKLVTNNVIKRSGKFLSVNKDWESWGVVKTTTFEDARGCQNNNGGCQNNNKRLSKQQPQKIKDNIQKRGIKSPKEIMSWKRYEEPIIDADGDGTASEVEITNSKYKYHISEVRKLYRLFRENYPRNWEINRTERISAENILDEHGLEMAEVALGFYSKYGKSEFCPQINKPSDLDRKWENLQQFRDKTA